MLELLVVFNSIGISWLIYSSLQKQTKVKKSIILDSCALIDGRVVDIVKSGFLQDTFVVPQFVLRELQMLADGSDNHKRARARFGLENANELKQLLGSQFVIDTLRDSALNTDDNLLWLAKKRQAKLCTTDYNLNQVASSEGVVVLNVNELSHAMRATYLPGEEQQVKIVQRGESRQQGVGYLEDGSMVVVEGAAKLVGTKQDIILERTLQTVAGKMSFAHIKNKKK